MNKVTQMNKLGYCLRDVTSLINQAFSQMIFKDGFVHADPHPGNMLVRQDPKTK